MEIEKPIGEGKTVDIVATKEGERLAIEIETRKSEVLENVRKCRSNDFAENWVVCLNDGTKRDLLEKLDNFEVKDCKRKGCFPREILFKKRFIDQK